MLFSAADPELKELADKIRGMIPEDSPLRSKVAERIIGVVKGWVKSQTDSMSPVAGAVVEKLTDLSDFFVGDSDDNEKTTKAKATAQDWMEKFFVAAEKRLENTDPANLGAEKEKILQEFKLRKEILDAIEAVRKEAHGPATPAKSTESPTLEDFLNQMEKMVEKLVTKPVRDLNTTLSKMKGYRATQWECTWFGKKGGSK